MKLIPTRKHALGRIYLSVFFLLCLFVLSLLGGVINLDMGDLWQQFTHRLGCSANAEDQDRFELISTVLWQIRFPRACLAVLVGFALGLSGVLVQALFRNPLAEPSLIGVSAGSAIATLLGMILSGSACFAWLNTLGLWFFPLAGFLGGLIATAFVFKLASRHGNADITHLLLTGIAINAFASGIIAMMITVASDQSLRSFVFWSLGSFAQANNQIVLVLLPFVLIPAVALIFFVKPLNLLLFGEAEAYHLGVNIHRLKTVIILLVSLMISACVSLVGIISFVGLVVPHLVRIWVGPNHRYLLPGSAIMGAGLLLVADWVCRQLNLGQEMPIGILTSLIGAPFFLFLLYGSRKKFLF